MGMQTMERAITEEARRVFCNPKLRVKDILEWSSGNIKPQAGEVVVRLPGYGVDVAIAEANDKRSKTGKG